MLLLDHEADGPFAVGTTLILLLKLHLCVVYVHRSIFRSILLVLLEAMIFSTLLGLAAASTALAVPMDMRGLSRLRNETLTGRAIFPSGGFKGVNLGAWFVFGESVFPTRCFAMLKNPTKNHIWLWMSGTLWCVLLHCVDIL